MMDPIELYHKSKDAHIKRDYTSDYEEPNMLEIKKFCNYFPNEAIFIIDCKNAILHSLNKNFEKITGCSCMEEDEIYPLYNHIEKKEFILFSKFTSRLVELATSNPQHWQEFTDLNQVIYKSHKGKVLLKKPWQ